MLAAGVARPKEGGGAKQKKAALQQHTKDELKRAAAAIQEALGQ